MTRIARIFVGLALAGPALSGLALAGLKAGDVSSGVPVPPARMAAGTIAGTIAYPMPEDFVLAARYVSPADTPDGRIYVEEGFESDLAGILAARLGRPVRLRPASEPGAPDGTLLRLRPDDPRLASGAALALGYSSGLGVAMRSDTTVRRWEDLAERTVCVSEANAEGEGLARGLGARVEVVRAPAVALMRLRTGACDAAIHDRALLDALFTSRAWAKFSATLPPTGPTVLALLPAPTAAGAALRREAPALADAAAWRERQARWGATVAFEVYRDQVGGDCH